VNHLGIDPGSKGYWFAIHDDGYDFRRMPRTPEEWRALSVWLDGRCLFDTTHAVIEDVHSMPGDAKNAAFSFGMNFGRCHLALELVGAELLIQTVTPSVWKPRIVGAFRDGSLTDEKAIEKDKKQSVIRWAQATYPNISLIPPGCRVPNDNLAEALALAHYAKNRWK
jgi:hypothetical protein